MRIIGFLASNLVVCTGAHRSVNPARGRHSRSMCSMFFTHQRTPPPQNCGTGNRKILQTSSASAAHHAGHARKRRRARRHRAAQNKKSQLSRIARHHGGRLSFHIHEIPHPHSLPFHAPQSIARTRVRPNAHQRAAKLGRNAAELVFLVPFGVGTLYTVNPSLKKTFIQFIFAQNNPAAPTTTPRTEHRAILFIYLGLL